MVLNIDINGFYICMSFSRARRLPDFNRICFTNSRFNAQYEVWSLLPTFCTPTRDLTPTNAMDIEQWSSAYRRRLPCVENASTVDGQRGTALLIKLFSLFNAIQQPSSFRRLTKMKIHIKRCVHCIHMKFCVHVNDKMFVQLRLRYVKKLWLVNIHILSCGGNNSNPPEQQNKYIFAN